ncbi:uncharacterized protein ACWYII_011713 isoform 2-T2 [Salvelinus alpinus]
MGNTCFQAKKTQSEKQHEKNQDAGPSEGQNPNNCHPHQPLTIPQQCKEDQSGTKTEVYYENHFLPWKWNITALIQNNHVESTVPVNSTVVPFQAGVAAVNIPPHLGFISIGSSPDCVQAALPHTDGSSSQHSPQHQLARYHNIRCEKLQ